MNIVTKSVLPVITVKNVPINVHARMALIVFPKRGNVFVLKVMIIFCFS